MDPQSSAPKHGVFRVVLWLFFLQIISVAAYVVVSFSLPTRVAYLTGGNAAIHVAAAHAVMFFVVAGMWVLIRAVDFSRAPRGYPLNRNLAEMNAFISTLANAVLLLLLGVEDWVQAETAGTTFSVLRVIQVLGAAELALVGLSGAGCVWRAVAYLRAGGGAGLPDAAMGEGLLTAAARGEGGRRGTQGGGADLFILPPGSPALAPRSSASEGAPPEPMSPRLGPLPGGSAQQRLQERVTLLESERAELLVNLQRLALELEAEEGGGRKTPGPGGSPAAAAPPPPAAAGDGQDPPQSPSELASVVRSLSASLASAAVDAAAAHARIAALEDRLAFYEKELRRAAQDAKALHAQLREQKRTAEKLHSTLDLEREANEQAQRVIRSIAAGSGARAAVGSAGGLALPLPLPGEAGGPASRTASLAGRASFAAMASPPGPPRTQSRSAAAAPPPFP